MNVVTAIEYVFAKANALIATKAFVTVANQRIQKNAKKKEKR